MITELIRPKTPAPVGGGFQRAVKSSMDSANIQKGLKNPPLNEVSFNIPGPARGNCFGHYELRFFLGLPDTGPPALHGEIHPGGAGRAGRKVPGSARLYLLP
ncbi:MAG: hypothetical protein AB1815_05480 [Bacillota bacterium]